MKYILILLLLSGCGEVGKSNNRIDLGDDYFVNGEYVGTILDINYNITIEYKGAKYTTNGFELLTIDNDIYYLDDECKYPYVDYHPSNDSYINHIEAEKMYYSKNNVIMHEGELYISQGGYCAYIDFAGIILSELNYLPKFESLNDDLTFSY